MFSWNNKYFLICCKCFYKLISDSVIESITLSKISTTRLSTIPKDLNSKNIQTLSPTSSFTGSIAEFSSFPNRLNNKRRLEQTLNMNKIEEEIEQPIQNIFAKINVNIKSQSMESINTLSTTSGDSIISISTPNSNQSTPISNPLTVPTKFPIPIKLTSTQSNLGTLNDGDENFDTSDDDNDDYEIP